MIHKSVLSNGVRVLSEPMPQVVSATIGIWVENGSRYEQPDQNGVSHFIEHLLFKGTRTRTAAQIAEQIDAVGGVLNAFTGKEYTCYYAKVLGTDLAMATDLLADMFLDSVFDPAEIERERQVVLQEISQADDTPDDSIHDLFNENYWAGHPLSLPIFGSQRTVNAMDRELMTSFMAAALPRRAAFLSRRPGRSIMTRWSSTASGCSRDRGRRPARPDQPAPSGSVVLNHEKTLGAGPSLPRRSRYRPDPRTALRRLRAEHRARRRHVVAAVPGSARKTRPGLQHLFVHVVFHRLRLLRGLCGHQSRMGRRGDRSHARRAAQGRARGSQAALSWSARAARSRATCCSGWNPPTRG